MQNVTDVDDPLLERAARDGVDWRGARRARDRALPRGHGGAAVLPPARLHRRRRGHPGDRRAAIDGCGSAGAAYDVDGDIYFSVHSDPRFGAVGNLDDADHARGSSPSAAATPTARGKKTRSTACSGRRAAAGRAGVGHGDLGAGPAGLAHRVRGHRPGAPRQRPSTCRAAAATWPSRTTRWARPRRRSLTGEWPFARHYVHAGMVGLDGEKMSKSRGNLVFVSQLRADGHDPMAIRLALLAHHYRSDWEWTDAELTAAEARLARWREAVARPAGPPAEPVLDGVRRHQADDLDAPGALQVVDRWATDAAHPRRCRRGRTRPGRERRRRDPRHPPLDRRTRARRSRVTRHAAGVAVAPGRRGQHPRDVSRC